MNQHSLAKAFAAGLVCLASHAVHATDNVISVGLLENYTNATYIGLINHTTPGESSGTFFTDYFNFSTSGSGGSSVATTLTLGDFLDIDNLTVTLYDGTGSSMLGSIVAGPVASGITLNAVLTPNQPYALVVSGTTSGSFGGSYSAAISAVPEASTYAMLLAGLGLVGFSAGRRKHT